MDEFESLDKRTPRLFVIEAAPDALLEELAYGEIPFEPLSKRDIVTGQTRIRVFLPEHFAMTLAAKFGAAARAQPEGTHARHGQWPPMPTCTLVPDPSTSDYIWGYADIENLLFQTAALGAGQQVSLGNSFLGREIRAIKFGPLDGAPDVPAVYIVATQHAREWGAAGTAVALIRELTSIVLDTTGTVRPNLRKALEHAAIVIVPVANPDGYEFSRTANRSWRGNMNTISCQKYGVNLNRNHPATFAAGGASYPICNSDNYRGAGPASEPETVAIDSLLKGSSFELPEFGVVVLDYHTYSDLLVYPSGYKEKTDPMGPACDDYDTTNCQGADFQALRELLGDTTSHRANPPLFVERRPSAPFIPFRRDAAPNNLYNSGGTLVDQGAYGPNQMLSATVELTSYYYFQIECDPAYDQVIKKAADGQLDVLERILSAELVSTDRSKAYFPTHTGSLASGFLTREYPTGVQPEEVRGTFSKAVWRSVDTGALSLSFDGTPVTASPLRQGTHYALYGVETSNTPKSLCAPCSVKSAIPGFDLGGEDQNPECSGCVDLCDPGRLTSPNGAWVLASGQRGSSGDCWWEPKDIGTLYLPRTFAPWLASRCTFSFSYAVDSPALLDYEALKVYRDSPAGLEVVWSSKQFFPYYPIVGGPTKQGTVVIEANEFLPGRVPQFSFDATDPSILTAGLHIFDPIIYCRIGAVE